MRANARKLKKTEPVIVDPVRSLLGRVEKAYLPKDYLDFSRDLQALAQSDVGRKVQADWQQAQAILHGDKEGAPRNAALFRVEKGNQKTLVKRNSLFDNPLAFLLLLQNELLRRRLADHDAKHRPGEIARSLGLSLSAMMKQDPIERQALQKQSHEEWSKEESERRRAKELKAEARTKSLLSEHAHRSYRGVAQSELPDPSACLWFGSMTLTDYVEATGQGEDKIEVFLRSNNCKPIEQSARNKRRRYGIETNFKVLNHWLCDWVRHKRQPNRCDKRQRIDGQEQARRTHDLRLSWLAVTIVHCMKEAPDRLGELLLCLEPSLNFLRADQQSKALLVEKIEKLLKLSPPPRVPMLDSYDSLFPVSAV